MIINDYSGVTCKLKITVTNPVLINYKKTLKYILKDNIFVLFLKDADFKKK